MPIKEIIRHCNRDAIISDTNQRNDLEKIIHQIKQSSHVSSKMQRKQNHSERLESPTSHQNQFMDIASNIIFKERIKQHKRDQHNNIRSCNP